MNRSSGFVVTWGMIMGIPVRLILNVLVCLFLLTRSAMCQEERESTREQSGTATIRGIISVHPSEESTGKHSHDPMRERYNTHQTPDDMSMAGQPVAEEWKRSERAVVYLEGPAIDQLTYPVPEKHPVLNQKNLEFHPRVLPILVGTTVDFPNHDNLFHNVFSYSQPKEFDLGRYPRNDSRSVRFDEPGIVRVYCDIHSHMNATILVLSNPYFAIPSDVGKYVIQQIPPGKYTLVSWYDRDVVERRPVELKAGETLEVNFTF
jgi:plastocyanin